MESNNRKLSVYLDKDVYEGFIKLANKQNINTFDLARKLIEAVVEASK